MSQILYIARVTHCVCIDVHMYTYVCVYVSFLSSPGDSNVHSAENQHSGWKSRQLGENSHRSPGAGTEVWAGLVLGMTGVRGQRAQRAHEGQQTPANPRQSACGRETLRGGRSIFRREGVVFHVTKCYAPPGCRSLIEAPKALPTRAGFPFLTAEQNHLRSFSQCSCWVHPRTVQL